MSLYQAPMQRGRHKGTGLQPGIEDRDRSDQRSGGRQVILRSKTGRRAGGGIEPVGGRPVIEHRHNPPLSNPGRAVLVGGIDATGDNSGLHPSRRLLHPTRRRCLDEERAGDHRQPHRHVCQPRRRPREQRRLYDVRLNHVEPLLAEPPCEPKRAEWQAIRKPPAAGPTAGLRAQYHLPPDAPLIGSVAIFYPRMQPSPFVPPALHGRLIKGHEELVRAMPAVLARHPEARLVLVGTGWGEQGEATMREVAALAEATGVGNRVIFTGYRSDIAAIYRDLDVSVQASLNENLGGTVESLLMARPTVATRVAGMTDSVIDCETGLLVNPSDPDDLARAINCLRDNPVAAALLGAAGRALMLSRFTLETTAHGLATLYRDQRAARRAAWRLSRMLMRVSVGGALASLRFTRALFVDHLLLRRLGAGMERRISRLRGLIPFA